MSSKLILVCICFVVMFLTGCDNENFNLQSSKATSEADKNVGVILYAGFSFALIRVNIDGVDYIVNTAGGLVRERDK